MNEEYMDKQNEDDESRDALTENQISRMEQVAEHLDSIASGLDGEPTDPKVVALLRIAADLLMEQAHMEKYYPRDEPSLEAYKLLENKDSEEEEEKKINIATAEELSQWFNLSGLPEPEKDEGSGEGSGEDSGDDR